MLIGLIPFFIFGWQPQTTFEELIEMMVQFDWELARPERWLKQRPAAAAA